jgi:hypothetical protein
MKKITISAAAAVLVLAACGSSQPAAVPHPADLAAKIHGCHGYAATEAALYAREQGQCTLGDGDTADIATFSTEQAARNYLTVAQGFGGVYVTGSLWIVQVDTQADAEEVQHALGGTIR